MSEDNFNLDQLKAPTEETLNGFDATTRRLVEFSQELGQVATRRSRGAAPIIGYSEGQTYVNIGCSIDETGRPGEANKVRSTLSLAISHWPKRQTGERVHMQEPVRLYMTGGKIYEDTMSDVERAFAMTELQEYLPPETMEWVSKVRAEASSGSDPDFRRFAVHDLLDQAPSAEQLMASHPDRFTGKDQNEVNSYAVAVQEYSSTSASIRCNNGSDVSYHFTTANDAYWEQNPNDTIANIQVRTANGTTFMYLAFHDGSKQLTARVFGGEYGRYESIKADLRAAGATVVEHPDAFALGEEVRAGVQAPNDATMDLMSRALQDAIASGADERFLKRQ